MSTHIPFMLRIPTSEEWDQAVDTLGCRSNMLHWNGMFTWTQDAAPTDYAKHICRGYESPRHQCFVKSDVVSANLGYRPILECLDESALSEIPDGTPVSAATLYLGPYPVPLPSDPRFDGDIQTFSPEQEIELRPSASYPLLHVTWLKFGHVLLSDRALLKNISWRSLEIRNLIYGRRINLPKPVNPHIHTVT